MAEKTIVLLPPSPLDRKIGEVKMAKSPFSLLFFAGKKGEEATAASNFDRDAAISKRRRGKKDGETCVLILPGI